MLHIKNRPDEPYFPGFEPVPTDALFFAIFPDAWTARRTVELADELRGACNLKGRPPGAHRFHVSLHSVGAYAGLPNDVVRKARDAASSLAAAPFDIAFDYVESFARNEGNPPLVLRNRRSCKPLIAFHRSLGDAMAGRGLRVARTFTPHMTLLYDARSVEARTVEPVAWTVREFVLVRSRWGWTQHIPLGRWPLREASLVPDRAINPPPHP